jgi:hypothetical protein
MMHAEHMGISIHVDTPIAGWFIIENPVYPLVI